MKKKQIIFPFTLKEDEERLYELNNTCPKCDYEGSIDKYCYIEGHFNERSGLIKTLPVNECKNCGNQWEKNDIRFYHKDHDYIYNCQFIDVILNNVDKDNKEADQLKDQLKNFYAESIYTYLQDYKSSDHHYFPEITYERLLLKFKSVKNDNLYNKSDS